VDEACFQHSLQCLTFGLVQEFGPSIFLEYSFTCNADSDFLALLGAEIIRYCEFMRLDSDDHDVGLTIMRLINRIVSHTYLVCVLTAAAKSWCIAQSAFPMNDAFCFSALGFVSASFWSLPEVAALHQFDLAAGMLYVLAGAIVLRELSVSCQDSALNLWIYLLAIRRAGIDPRTTPIYRRYRIFRRLHWSVIVCALIMAGQLFMALFVSILFWLTEIVHDLTRLFLGVVWGWVFRITAIGLNGRYADLAPTANAPDELSDVDLDGLLSHEITVGGSM
jgi:hypothetical protein